MQFATGATLLTIGPFQSQVIVGKESFVQDPMILTTFLPNFAGLFQIVRQDSKQQHVIIHMDIQFQDNHRQKPYIIKASIVRLPRLLKQNIVQKTMIEYSFEKLGTCEFTFTEDLSTFEDEPAGKLNVFSCIKEFDIDNSIEKGDRVALLLEYDNMVIRASSVNADMN